MSFLSKIFGNKSEEGKPGGMEDYMTLVRVYFQASLASNLGITHIPTVNNKLGVGEKSHCKKMLKELYKTDDIFFKEIDQSIRKNCHKIQDVQVYLIQFQNFSQDLMMLMGNLMKFKLRVPSIFRKTIYAMTQKTVGDIFTKNDYTDASVIKAALAVRQYNKKLGFSQQWITGFVYQVVMLAKKEPKPADDDKK